MGWLIVLVIVGILVLATIYFNTSYNASVIQELQTNPEGERALKVMAITFPDGRRVPVNYLREDNLVFAGSDFGWWKKISNDGTLVELLIKGEKLTGTAKVSQDMEYTYQVFERLRPTAPTWASKLVGAKLVVIELDAS